MEKQQIAKNESYDRVDNFYLKYKTELDLIFGFTDIINNFHNARHDLDDAALIQGIQITGILKDFESLQNELINTLIPFALLGAVQARTANNEILSEKLTHYPTYLSQVSRTIILIRATEIRNALNENLHTLANPTGIITTVTPANIATVDALLASFQVTAQHPKEAIIERKTQGTEVLVKEFKAVDDAVDTISDLIFATYLVSNPDRISEFNACKKLAIYGVRHTGFLAFISDANPAPDALTSALMGIEVKIIELKNKTAISDINGMAGIIKFKPGTYHVEFSGAGYQTKEMIITFKLGQMIDLDIQLNKINQQ